MRERTHETLSIRQSLISSKTDQLVSLVKIPFNTVTAQIHCTQQRLRFRVSLPDRFHHPFTRLVKITFDFVCRVIHFPDYALGVGVALFSFLIAYTQGFGMVLAVLEQVFVQIIPFFSHVVKCTFVNAA